MPWCWSTRASRARLFSKSSLAWIQEFLNYLICLYAIKKKNLSKSTCPTGSFTCPGPSGSGKRRALASVATVQSIHPCISCCLYVSRFHDFNDFKYVSFGQMIPFKMGNDILENPMALSVFLTSFDQLIYIQNYLTHHFFLNVNDF